MDAGELLLRGAAGLTASIVLVLAARIRLRRLGDADAPTHLGLD